MPLIQFKDTKCIPDTIHTYSTQLRQNSTPIIIDNGCCQCRAGWATNKSPLLTFKNLIAKPRKDRYPKKDTGPNPSGEASAPQQTLQVGNDITNIEAVRFQLKTQFDRNVVTHFEAQQHLFDYVFQHLGLDINRPIRHPIVLTEAILNPTTCRSLMSELLFEQYQVSGISYGIDCLFGYYFGGGGGKIRADHALLVHVGYQTCHVIPILDGRPRFTHARRLNTGGYHVITFLYRILQLKYPSHTAHITLSRAEELLHTICAVAENYGDELKRWTASEYYQAHVNIIQLPYACGATNSAANFEQQKERRKECARRLVEINARRREGRLTEVREKLDDLVRIRQMVEQRIDDGGGDDDEIDDSLAQHQLRNVSDLHKAIQSLTQQIDKITSKIPPIMSNGGDDVIGGGGEAPPPPKLPKQFESGAEMTTYLQNIEKMKQEILRKKHMRKQRRADMAKRRTAAGQERMRIISQLAKMEKGRDDFGLRDEDWDIYKTISKDGDDSDSEEENEKLIQLEGILRVHDPNSTNPSGTSGGNMAENHQLHVGIEMYRAPELLFKPYMFGSHEAGLSELIGYVLGLCGPDDQLKLAENVVISGGLANLPGLQHRILTDLISIRPFESIVKVRTVNGPLTAGWDGARWWAKSAKFRESLLTRAMYDERGVDYFLEHTASNPYYPLPKDHTAEQVME